MGFLDRLKDLLGGRREPDPQDDYYDDGYDDGYYEEPEPRSSRRPRREDAGMGTGVLGNPRRPEADSVSVYTRSGRQVTDDELGTGYTSAGAGEGYAGSAYEGTSDRTGIVRAISGKLPPYVLKVTGFNDCETLAKRVRTGQPVVLDLSDVDYDLGARVLDFGFGLAAGVDGSCEKLAPTTIAVYPAGSVLTDSDLASLRASGIL